MFFLCGGNLRVEIKICTNSYTKMFIKVTGKEPFRPLTVDTIVKNLMAVDMLNINWTSEEVEISNSYCDENARHGHVVCVPHLLDLYDNRLPCARRASTPGSGSR